MPTDLSTSVSEPLFMALHHLKTSSLSEKRLFLHSCALTATYSIAHPVHDVVGRLPTSRLVARVTVLGSVGMKVTRHGEKLTAAVNGDVVGITVCFWTSVLRLACCVFIVC